VIRRGGRERRIAGSIRQLPFARLVNPYSPIEILSDDQVDAIIEGALSVLEGRGMRFLEPSSRKLLESAGAERLDDLGTMRMDRGIVISETHHGFVCANAGVDQSNVDADMVALLPEDSDRSARRIREALRTLIGGDVHVIIADTFGRPWREGLVNIAIGVAGFAPLKSYLGDRDPAGRPLQATILAIADELAGAAEPVMGKLDRIPAALVRGLPLTASEEGSKALLRDPARDLFR